MNMQVLKDAGLKVTNPRKLILEYLERSAKQHLTAEVIQQGLCLGGVDLGIATIYRVLSQLESAGLIRRNYFTRSGAVFELNTALLHKPV